MKFTALTSLLALTAAPLASATCEFQTVNANSWRLSTYSSQNCINKVQDVTHGGFGVWCINIPDKTRSFIFGTNGYAPILGESCQIFFYTSETCSGTEVGRSDGRWLKSKLSATGETMASAYVQCTKFLKRDGAEGQGAPDRKFVRGDDGAWYQEVKDGALMKVKTREAVEFFA